MIIDKEKVELVGGPQCGKEVYIQSDTLTFPVEYRCLGHIFTATYQNNNNGKAQYLHG